ncbi:unnamed protein product [Cyprideis torosa]|uniref:carbonic anhydrase n=1 Tax=Cyprideis torosa TaxID=163714 RepID=A0A7R8WCY1_9CRUS|nr:unnamed protein product [Cyprideis torosa]CAG0887806.1 unnamed protein product [Cyprideis torosa]
MFNPLQPRQGCLEDEPEQFERCAARRNRQSPIDINTVETVPAQLPPWDFQHYGRNFETVCVFNTGDTVEWILNAPHRPSVAGAGLRGRYILEQIHVHWAGIGRGGSEHQINGESYDLEFHFVHYHERFRNFSEALSSLKLDALVVLGVFVEVSDFYPPHSGIEHLMPDFDVVQFPGSVDVLSGHIHNLQHLLPENKDTFFRYEGSLTSGKHGEVVIWTVFENPIFMSTEQANRFRSVHAANGATICENNRSVQPVNGRLILRNVPLSKASSAETPSWPLFSDLESLLSARNDVLLLLVIPGTTSIPDELVQACRSGGIYYHVKNLPWSLFREKEFSSRFIHKGSCYASSYPLTLSPTALSSNPSLVLYPGGSALVKFPSEVAKKVNLSGGIRMESTTVGTEAFYFPVSASFPPYMSRLRSDFILRWEPELPRETGSSNNCPSSVARFLQQTLGKSVLELQPSLSMSSVQNLPVFPSSGMPSFPSELVEWLDQCVYPAFTLGSVSSSRGDLQTAAVLETFGFFTPETLRDIMANARKCLQDDSSVSQIVFHLLGFSESLKTYFQKENVDVSKKALEKLRKCATNGNWEQSAYVIVTAEDPALSDIASGRIVRLLPSFSDVGTSESVLSVALDHAVGRSLTPRAEKIIEEEIVSWTMTEVSERSWKMKRKESWPRSRSFRMSEEESPPYVTWGRDSWDPVELSSTTYDPVPRSSPSNPVVFRDCDGSRSEPIDATRTEIVLRNSNFLESGSRKLTPRSVGPEMSMTYLNFRSPNLSIKPAVDQSEFRAGHDHPTAQMSLTVQVPFNIISGLGPSSYGEQANSVQDICTECRYSPPAIEPPTIKSSRCVAEKTKKKKKETKRSSPENKGLSGAPVRGHRGKSSHRVTVPEKKGGTAKSRKKSEKHGKYSADKEASARSLGGKKKELRESAGKDLPVKQFKYKKLDIPKLDIPQRIKSKKEAKERQSTIHESESSVGEERMLHPQRYSPHRWLLHEREDITNTTATILRVSGKGVVGTDPNASLGRANSGAVSFPRAGRGVPATKNVPSFKTRDDQSLDSEHFYLAGNSVHYLAGLSKDVGRPTNVVMNANRSPTSPQPLRQQQLSKAAEQFQRNLCHGGGGGDVTLPNLYKSDAPDRKEYKPIDGEERRKSMQSLRGQMRCPVGASPGNGNGLITTKPQKVLPPVKKQHKQTALHPKLRRPHEFALGNKRWSDVSGDGRRATGVSIERTVSGTRETNAKDRVRLVNSPRRRKSLQRKGALRGLSQGNGRMKVIPVYRKKVRRSQQPLQQPPIDRARAGGDRGEPQTLGPPPGGSRNVTSPGPYGVYDSNGLPKVAENSSKEAPRVIPSSNKVRKVKDRPSTPGIYGLHNLREVPDEDDFRSKPKKGLSSPLQSRMKNIPEYRDNPLLRLRNPHLQYPPTIALHENVAARQANLPERGHRGFSGKSSSLLSSS